jgi:hypothetical protein
VNQIEEIFHIQDKQQARNEISTGVRIQGVTSKGNNELLLGLLDTGETGIFVKRTALQNY